MCVFCGKVSQQSRPLADCNTFMYAFSEEIHDLVPQRHTEDKQCIALYSCLLLFTKCALTVTSAGQPFSKYNEQHLNMPLKRQN